MPKNSALERSRSRELPLHIPARFAAAIVVGYEPENMKVNDGTHYWISGETALMKALCLHLPTIAVNPTVAMIKEYLSLIPTRRADRRVLFWAYLCVPLQYLFIGMHWYNMFLIFIPVWAFLWIAMRMVLRGDTKDFLRAAGTIHWGLMTMVFGLSHLGLLVTLPLANPSEVDGRTLVLFLVFVVELSDVLQYVWGKTLGRHKVIPTVSPNE